MVHEESRCQYSARYASCGWPPPASGQRFVCDINQVQNILLVAWQTFAHDASPNTNADNQRGYTLPASFVPGISALDGIGIFETSGGVFNTSSTTTTTRVGRAALVVHSCNTATLSYTFFAGTRRGQSGTVERSRIASAPAACGCRSARAEGTTNGPHDTSFFERRGWQCSRHDRASPRAFDSPEAEEPAVRDALPRLNARIGNAPIDERMA